MMKKRALAAALAVVLFVTSFSSAILMVSAQSEEEWLYSSDADASITGDNENGYSVRLNGGTAYYNKPLNPANTIFQFNPQSIPVNTWVVVSISDFNKAANPESDYGGWTSNEGLNLMIARHLTGDGRSYLDIDVMSYINVGYYPKVSLIWDYDFTQPVAIDFRKVEGNWRLFVNDEMQVHTDLTFNYYFDQFGDTAYYNFNNQFTGDDVKFINKYENVWDADASIGNVELSQSENKGTVAFGSGDSMAVMNQAINMLENMVSFKIEPPQEANEGWAILQLAPNKELGDGILWNASRVEEYGGLPLFFEFKKDSQSMRMWIYTGGWENTDIVTIPNFDWSGTHTVRIVKEDSAYYVELDKTVYRNKDIARWVEKLDGQDSYVRWATYVDGLTVENSIVKGFWVTDNSDVAVTGNETNGYAFSGNIMAGYSLPVDLEKQELTLTADPTDWLGIRFTNDYRSVEMSNRYNYENGITFFVQRWNDAGGNILKLWHMGDGNKNVILLTSDFDWGTPHTYGLEEEDDKWYFKLDGVTLKSIDLTDMVEELLGRGDVYLQLACSPGEGTTVTCSGIKIVNKTATQPEPEGEWIKYGGEGAVTVTQGYNGKYKLDFTQSTLAAYTKPLDLTQDRISFQVPYVAGGWTTLQLADTTASLDGYNLFFNQTTIQERGGIQLIFDNVNNGATLNMYLFDGTAKQAIYINSFAWNATHTLQVVKEDERYYLKVDGNTYRNLGDEQYYYEITDYVSKLDGKDVYMRFGAYVPGAAPITLNEIGIMDPNEQHYLWISDTTQVQVSGDEMNGYEWSGNAMVGYSRPLNIDHEYLEFQMRTDSWAAIRFSNDYTQLGMDNRLNADTGIVMILGREGNGALNLYMWDSGAQNILYATNFDWDVSHAYGFTKFDGRWYFTFDGNIQVGLDLTSHVEQLLAEGDIFVQLTCAGESGSTVIYNNIRYVNKEGYVAPSGSSGGYDDSGNDEYVFDVDYIFPEDDEMEFPYDYDYDYDSVDTGDHFNILLALIVMLASGTLAGVSFLHGRRERIIERMTDCEI